MPCTRTSTRCHRRQWLWRMKCLRHLRRLRLQRKVRRCRFLTWTDVVRSLPDRLQLPCRSSSELWSTCQAGSARPQRWRPSCQGTGTNSRRHRNRCRSTMKGSRIRQSGGKRGKQEEATTENKKNDWMIDWSIDWVTDWLIDRLGLARNWLTERLIDWLTGGFEVSSFPITERYLPWSPLFMSSFLMSENVWDRLIALPLMWISSNSRHSHFFLRNTLHLT